MKRMKRMLEYILLPAVALILGCGAMTGPGDVIVSDPIQAVADARRMIEEKKSNPEIHKGWIYPNALPESLRFQGVCYAQVFEDHMNIVLARNPDWQIGARIWATASVRKHEDKKTKYEEIFFFDYTNDLQESPDNIL